MSIIQDHWIYFNYIEDQKERIEEIKEIIREMNWRLRPEVADKIEKKINDDTNKKNIDEQDIMLLEKIFNK